MAGASYLEVHKAGGGIHFTVDKTREASEEVLLEDLVKRLHKMTRAGKLNSVFLYLKFVKRKLGQGESI